LLATSPLFAVVGLLGSLKRRQEKRREEKRGE
jgi:hypothetical protein